MNDRDRLENTSCKNPTLASEIIADQSAEIEKLKAELQDKQENLDICEEYDVTVSLGDMRRTGRSIYVSSENCGVYAEIKR